MSALIGHRNNSDRRSYLIFREVSLHHAELYCHIAQSDDTTNRLSGLSQLMCLHFKISNNTIKGGSQHTATQIMLCCSKLSLGRSKLTLR